MKKNIISLVVLLSVAVVSFGQKKGNDLQYQVTNSKNNPQVIVKDTLKGQQPSGKHKVEGKKQSTPLAIADPDTSSLSTQDKNKLIVNKKKQ